nr:transcriptional regulator [Rhodoferax sp.]
MVTKPKSLPPRASLADALFPKVRQRVLAVLFNAPDRSFFMGEVIALANSGTGAVQRELAGLAAAGILSVHKQGKQKHYQANADAPIFAALTALVAKTMGVVNVLHACLGPLAGQVSAAFVYDEAVTASTGAVTVVLFSLGGDADAVAQAMQDAANTLARQVSFTLYTPDSMATAISQSSNFVSRLLQPAKTWLKGSQDQLFSQPS